MPSMVCWQPASSALLEWLPLASCHSWFWQCETTDALQGAWATALDCKQLHAGLNVSFKLLQAQRQGQIHEGLLVSPAALLFAKHLCTPSAGLSMLVRHLTCVVLGMLTVQSRLLCRLAAPQSFLHCAWCLSAPQTCPLHAWFANSMQVWHPSVILAAFGHAPAAVRAGPQRFQ